MKWRFTRLRSMLDNCSCNFAPVYKLWSISGLSAATILVSSSFGSTSSHGRPCSSSTRLSMDCGGTSLSGRRAAVRMRASRGRRMQSCSEEPRAVTLKGDTQQVSCYHCQTSSLHACHQCDTLTTHCKHGVQLARSRRGRAKPKTDLVGWAAGNRECGKASEAQCDDHRTAMMPARANVRETHSKRGRVCV